MTDSVPRILIVLLCAIATLVLPACGNSEEQAKEDVCGAVADIGKQVDTLNGLTVAPGVGDQVQTSVDAIESDLKKVDDNVGDLEGEFRTEVQQANQAFSSAVKSTASALGEDFDVSRAQSQLQASLSRLAGSYQQAFADVQC